MDIRQSQRGYVGANGTFGADYSGGAGTDFSDAEEPERHVVTGSDDEIFEPSRSRLEAVGLLPSAIGWFPEKITTELDAVIVGMHAQIF